MKENEGLWWVLRREYVSVWCFFFASRFEDAGVKRTAASKFNTATDPCPGIKKG